MRNGGLWLLSLSSVIVVMAPPHFWPLFCPRKVAISPRTPRYKFDTPHEFQGRSVILTQPAEGPARRYTVSVIRMLTKSATYAGSLPRTLLILRHLAARASPHARGTVIAKRRVQH